MWNSCLAGQVTSTGDRLSSASVMCQRNHSTATELVVQMYQRVITTLHSLDMGHDLHACSSSLQPDNLSDTIGWLLVHFWHAMTCNAGILMQLLDWPSKSHGREISDINRVSERCHVIS